MEWDPLLRNHIKELDAKKPVILCGDLNVAHKEIDLANPKTNKKSAGFTVEERSGKYLDSVAWLRLWSINLGFRVGFCQKMTRFKGCFEMEEFTTMSNIIWIFLKNIYFVHIALVEKTFSVNIFCNFNFEPVHFS